MRVVRVGAALAAGIVVAAGAILLAEGVAHAALSGDALFAAIACGYGLGAFAGSLVAAWIAGRRIAIGVPLLLAALALANLLAMPHPLWFAPMAGLMLAAGWLIGVRAAPRPAGERIAGR